MARIMGQNGEGPREKLNESAPGPEAPEACLAEDLGSPPVGHLLVLYLSKIPSVGLLYVVLPQYNTLCRIPSVR